jgi:uncharacterized protein (TIGR02594 family)
VCVSYSFIKNKNMPALPPKYLWLEKEPGPKMIQEALSFYGTKELPGKTANNKVIMAWANEIGGKVEKFYTADAVPWCGLFMAVIAKRTGRQLPVDPLWALHWGTFGAPSPEPMLGDVLTFIRPGGGHVALYVGEDKDCYHVLGGNQSDAVNITRIEKKRMYRARRPNYIKQPANVRKIMLDASGIISKNEG